MMFDNTIVSGTYYYCDHFNGFYTPVKSLNSKVRYEIREYVSNRKQGKVNKLNHVLNISKSLSDA